MGHASDAAKTRRRHNASVERIGQLSCCRSPPQSLPKGRSSTYGSLGTDMSGAVGGV